MQLSAQLREMLAKTVDVFDNFCSTHSIIFDHLPLDYQKLRSRVEEFRSFKKRLDYLRTRCAEHARIVSYFPCYPLPIYDSSLTRPSDLLA
jgi:hypothetical protein